MSVITKTEAGHTPGPWGWVYEDESMQTLCGTNPEYPDFGPEPLTGHVLSVSPCRACRKRTLESGEFNRCLGPSEDNARLIAAAPELLGALRECMDLRRRMHVEGEAVTTGEYERVHNLAVAAIAKAEGES